MRLLISSSIEASDLPAEFKLPRADVRHLVQEKFGIEDARRMKDDCARTSLVSERLVFVIFAENITAEAQNALLKLFEEPSRHISFYLIVPRASMILPTLRSRFIGRSKTKIEELGEEAREFLRSSYAERLARIGELSKKDPAALLRLVTALGQDPALARERDAKRALLQASTYVYNRGASRKMLLEGLALALPVTSDYKS